VRDDVRADRQKVQARGHYEQYFGARPLPAETRAYVATHAPLTGLGELAGPISVAVGHLKSWTEAPLFIGRRERATAANQVLAEHRSNCALMSDPMRNIPALVPQAQPFCRRSSAGHLQ
jgi:hypothetical protein